MFSTVLSHHCPLLQQPRFFRWHEASTIDFDLHSVPFDIQKVTLPIAAHLDQDRVEHCRRRGALQPLKTLQEPLPDSLVACFCVRRQQLRSNGLCTSRTKYRNSPPMTAMIRRSQSYISLFGHLTSCHLGRCQRERTLEPPHLPEGCRYVGQRRQTDVGVRVCPT